MSHAQPTTGRFFSGGIMIEEIINYLLTRIAWLVVVILVLLIAVVSLVLWIIVR